MITINHKVVWLLVKGLVVLLYYRIIVVFASERIFKNLYTFGEVTGKIVDCFTCPVCRALFSLKVQISQGNFCVYGQKTVINCCYVKIRVVLTQNNSVVNQNHHTLNV